MSEEVHKPRLRGLALIPDSKRITFVLPVNKSSASTIAEERQTKEVAEKLTGAEARGFYESLLEETEDIKPSTSAFKIPAVPNRRPKRIAGSSVQTVRNPERNFTERDIHLFLRTAEEGNTEEVKRFLESGAPIDCTDGYGWTALMCASFAGHIETAKLLFNYGADLSARNSQHQSAFDLAASKKRRDILKLLIGIEENVAREKQQKKTVGYCQVCKSEYQGSEVDHLTKTSHLLNVGETGDRHPGYGIPETNVGYKLMKRNGWDEFRGLGREEEGKRFPIRTILKRDRSGLGTGKDKPRVTHFRPHDTRAVANVKERKVEKMTRRDIAKKHQKEKEFDLQFRESFRYDFEDFMDDYGCRVCNERYDAEDEKRIPRVLTGCGHTICQGCAQAIAQAGSPSITCPFDRIPTTLPDGTIMTLKKNFALIELMERVTYADHGSDGLERHMRAKKSGLDCDEDSSHPADVYCVVCESNLCEKCSQATHSTVTLSKHRRVPLSEKPPPPQHCRHHTSHTVEFVCKEEECEGTERLMCLLCRDYGIHEGHAHELLQREADLMKQKLQKIIAELTKQRDELSSWIVSVNSSITALYDGDTTEQTRTAIARHFERIREEVDKAEVEAIKTLDNYLQDRRDALKHQLNTYRQLSNKLGGACLELQRSIISASSELVTKREDLLALTESAKAERVQAPDDGLLSTLIPYTISKDNRLHLGHFIDACVVLLGLDGAGKTTITSRWKRCEPLPPPPTLGFNIETVHHKNFRLNFWDVGGLPKLRPFWKHYYSGKQALIYLIDGSAMERYDESVKELHKIVSNPSIQCPILVVINERRVEPVGARELDKLSRDLSGVPHLLKIHHCDALLGSGVDEVLDSLCSLINDYANCH
ncbi:unnamed protein product, partial [Mesorhabditis spiculigera]